MLDRKDVDHSCGQYSQIGLYEKYGFERLGTALAGEYLYLLRFDTE